MKIDKHTVILMSLMCKEDMIIMKILSEALAMYETSRWASQKKWNQLSVCFLQRFLYKRCTVLKGTFWSELMIPSWSSTIIGEEVAFYRNLHILLV